MSDLVQHTENDGATPQNDSRFQKIKRECWEWFKAFLFAFVIVMGCIHFVGELSVIDGKSMEPTFQGRERVTVNKMVYKIRDPKAREVVVIKVFAEEKEKKYIKRIVAVGGDRIQVKGDTVYINGRPIVEQYIQQAIEEAHGRGELYNDKDFPEVQVPHGHVFVMGDNRSNSTDSRMIGYVPLKDIVGRAELVCWPFDRFGWVNNNGEPSSKQ